MGVAVAALLTLLRWLDPQPLQDLRAASFDIYQQLKPRESVAAPVVVVAIDEAALAQQGQWPWPRRTLAALTDRLSQAGAASVSFDVLFAEPDRLSPRELARSLAPSERAALEALGDGDAIFAQALAQGPAALAFADRPGTGALPPPKAGIVVSGEEVASGLTQISNAILPMPQLLEAAAGLGHISLSGEQVGSRVREVPLLIAGGGTLYPALLLEGLRLGLGASTYVVQGDPSYPGITQSLRVGDVTVPLSEDGQFRFYAAPAGTVRTLSAARLLSDEPLPADEKAAIDGAIVLVGVSAAGLQDIRVTPLSEAMPGVAIHAQILEQILASQFLSRPAWLDGAEVIAIAGLSLLLILLASFVGPLVALAAAGLSAAAVLGGCWSLFSAQGLLVDPVAPIGGALLTVFCTTAFWYVAVERERRYIRQAFGRYVSPALLARIEQSPEALNLGGVNREITVLFMDVRGFTALSETLPPQETIRFLNTLHGALSIPVVECDGTLDKYIGDSLMAFWNAPLDVGDHPAKAAEAALRMRDAMAELNRSGRLGLAGHQEVRIGIGVHTGIACIGNVGTQRRLSYSAVGDTVNTAARIESACKEVGTDILLSAETARRLPMFVTTPAGKVELRGKSAAFEIFRLEGRASQS